jgi:hypothetical protein
LTIESDRRNERVHVDLPWPRMAVAVAAMR